ncbi:family A G protein-coupled receptor-like protein [Auriculariales sp. MPI-PUGE-AT-0066]|nr:family A G protein-coupled receptor-like protein [Auriculariales sp. MPI-PUGE-AT-0066]
MDSRSYDPARDMYMYSRTSRSIAIVHGTAGVLSCIVASTLFAHLAIVALYPMICRRFNSVSAGHDGGDNTKLKTQVSLFLMALFASDILQSIGGMLQLRWATIGGVGLHSSMCRLQGVAIMAGDLGVCYFNVVMAVHTFITIVLRRTITTFATVTIIAIGFLLVFMFSFVGPFAIATKEKGPFYGLAGLWCFVTDPYSGPRVYLHYVPIYVSLFMLLVIYISVFWKLRMRDCASQNTGTSGRASVLPENHHLRPYYAKVANKLLWYPTAYLCLVLPISMGRVVQAGNPNLKPPPQFMNFAITVLMLSGFVNGIIYGFTRKALSPFSTWAPQRKTDLSFLKRRSELPPTYAVWVTQERQQDAPGEEKYETSVQEASVQLPDIEKQGVTPLRDEPEDGRS